MRYLAPILLTGLLAASATSAMAQEPDLDPLRGYATREWLQELLQRYELSAGSSAYSPYLQQRARDEARRIRTRLDEGDFSVGDRVMLVVEDELTLSDTFTVAAGSVLQLPAIGAVSLRGVLRADLESHLRQHLAQFIRDPKVRVETLIRLSVFGAVGSPGFYIFASDQLFTEALMRTGVGNSADLDAVQIERGGQTILEGEMLQQAMVDGLTLDQLMLREGDRIVVPATGSGFTGQLSALQSPLRAVAILLALPAAIIGFSRIF